MTVKESQPDLYADLELLFRHQAGPAHDLRQTVQNSKGHGRLETCTLFASTDLNSYLDWTGLQQCL